MSCFCFGQKYDHFGTCLRLKKPFGGYHVVYHSSSYLDENRMYQQCRMIRLAHQKKCKSNIFFRKPFIDISDPWKESKTRYVNHSYSCQFLLSVLQCNGYFAPVIYFQVDRHVRFMKINCFIPSVCLSHVSHTHARCLTVFMEPPQI